MVKDQCNVPCPQQSSALKQTCIPDDDEPTYSYVVAEWPRRSDRRSGFKHGLGNCGRQIECMPYMPEKLEKPKTPEKKKCRKSDQSDQGEPDLEQSILTSSNKTTEEEDQSVKTKTWSESEGTGDPSTEKESSKRTSGVTSSDRDKDTEKDDNDDKENKDGDEDEDFCEKFCRKPYQYPIDPCLANRDPWREHLYNPNSDRYKCRGELFRERIAGYHKIKCKACDKEKFTRIIVDDKYHVCPPYKKPEDPRKRPLWGFPQNQWEIDEAKGKHAYKQMSSDPPWWPLPRFFRPLPPIPADICVTDDNEYEKNKHPDPTILTCVKPHCAHKVLRAVYRDNRGMRPTRQDIYEMTPTVEDPFLRKLIEETQLVFKDFMMKKVPILLIYGRPIKSIAEVRRKYCLSLAETHGFTYLTLDEEIALLAQKGAQAVEAGNHLFEGFKAMQRLALPIVLKLVTEKDKYMMTRQESMDIIKFIILSHHPAKGYIIDGFPWNNIDQVDFEKMMYPICCGIYFLNLMWTVDKSTPPEVIPPLYFRRSVDYSEYNVEEACDKFGLKTLKIIGAESLINDEEKVFALHAVVDEYLDAYDEVLDGNYDALIDEDLKYETFGETQGYGVNLEDYMPPKEEEDSEKQKSDASETEEERKKYLELDPLKRMQFDSTKGIDKYTPSQIDILTQFKVTPSEKRLGSVSEEGKDKSEKAEPKRKGKEIVCEEGDEECKKKKERRRRRRHRCRCRCRCHRRHRRSGEEQDDDHDYLPRSLGRSPGRRYPQGRGMPGMAYDDEDYGDPRNDRASYDSRGGRNYRRGRTPDKNGRFNTADSSAPDEDMGPAGPLIYDPRWGFTSTRRAGKHPDVHLPKLETADLQRDPRKKEMLADGKAGDIGGVYALPPQKTHQIPDPYNTMPHKPGNKPGDFLQDYPGPKAPDRFSKINRQQVPMDDDKIVKPTTPYTEEPTAGLRSLFSDTMSRVMAKNQADIRKIKYDKLKKKVAQVEYEIYQDDYRLPKYRFYKKYKDYTPEDFVKEQKNWIPCATCFDSFKEADQFYRKDTQAHLSLSKIQHDEQEAVQEREHVQGKGPLLNRFIACLCGEDNQAGLHIPGYKPEEKLEDNTDLDHMDELSDYRKRKEFPT